MGQLIRWHPPQPKQNQTGSGLQAGPTHCTHPRSWTREGIRYKFELQSNKQEAGEAEREREREREREVMATTVVVSDDEVEDEHLLSLVAAAEASALASKCRKISPSSTPTRSASGRGGGGGGSTVEEGSYMVALRGSRSSLWQQQQKELQQLRQKGRREDFKSTGGGYGTGVSASGSSVAGSCFKCGQSGHWARDCAGGGGGYVEPARGRVVDGRLGGEGDVPGKACPCGLGDCLVLTSNTTRNPGRKFYRCPVKAENGGCNFFEWCDNPASAVPASRSLLNNFSSVPELSCPCGAGSCLVLTAKTGKNIGQQFYRCPLDQGSGSCGFFKWCNQYKLSADLFAAESLCNTPNNTNYQSAGGRSASYCFKCGQDGHWVKDCPKSESDFHASTGGNYSASSGSCFKCGQVGHWARDCPVQNTSLSAGRRKASERSCGSYLGKSR